jgi:hypothetical protein
MTTMADGEMDSRVGVVCSVEVNVSCRFIRQNIDIGPTTILQK